jgi:hypothetical protein
MLLIVHGLVWPRTRSQTTGVYSSPTLVLVSVQTVEDEDDDWSGSACEHASVT